MCNQFVEWWMTTSSTKYYEESQTNQTQVSEFSDDQDQVRELALDFFHRRQEFDARESKCRYDGRPTRQSLVRDVNHS